jgi:predicted dehydrogenase
LGCGHPHVPDVLGVIAAEPDVRLAAAWDRDPAAVPGVISSHAVRDLDRAISRADAVVVCAPTDERPEICVRAARAGRPILVEKPLARTAAEARAAARELERSRTPALATLFLRELPALARLHAVIRSGLLGRISGASASYVHAGALDGMLSGPAAWLRDPRRSGAGGFADLGLHLLDAFSTLGATATLDVVTLDRGRPGAADLGGAGAGRWGEVPMTLRTSWVTRPAALELTLTGAAGTARIREGTLELSGGEGTPERWVGAPPDAGESVRAFLDRLRTRRFARDGLAPAIRAQETIERALRAG